VSKTQIAIDVLLAIGAVTTVLSAIALPTRKDLYERLHYLGPPATIGIGCFTLAILLDKHFSQTGLKALIVCVVLLFMNAILTHATARAARVRQFGRWVPDVTETRGDLDYSTAGLNSRPLVDSSDE
jgi:monovalent cation/proton antiporter MnhG/PhaG subunit